MPFVRYCCILWNEDFNFPSANWHWRCRLSDTVAFCEMKMSIFLGKMASEMPCIRCCWILWNENGNFPDGKLHRRCRSSDTVAFCEMKRSIFLMENVIGDAARPILFHFVKWKCRFSLKKTSLERPCGPPVKALCDCEETVAGAVITRPGRVVLWQPCVIVKKLLLVPWLHDPAARSTCESLV